MRTALVVVILLVVAVLAAVSFPGTPVAVTVGWAIYVVLALVTQTWGLAVLGVAAAIAAVWWTLRQHPYP